MCESCWQRKPVRWVLVDDDMEVEMCADCVRINRAEMKIEYIDMDK